jgi:hypothetical protein
MPTWLEDGKEHFGGAKGLAELKGIAESLAEPWRSSILWIPDDTEIPPPNNVAYWITSPWDNRNGTVTLAGDAAHPLPPRTSSHPHISPSPIRWTINRIDIPRPRPRPQPLHS